MYRLYAEGNFKICCKEEYLYRTFVELCQIYGEENVKIVRVKDEDEKENISKICS